MSYYRFDDEGAYVECDGCGDVTTFMESMDCWATISLRVGLFHLCSCECFYDWNYHVPWPGSFGQRPGDSDGKIPF